MVKPAPIDNESSYQALSAELQELLDELESGELDLDTAVSKYERGLEIVSELESRLANTENKVVELRSRPQKDA